MFSLTDIDQVAWLLVLLMGGWIVVNALVDLSGEDSRIRNWRKSADKRPDDIE